jgi:sRNA-binding carbon storage regulator CsrA
VTGARLRRTATTLLGVLWSVAACGTVTPPPSPASVVPERGTTETATDRPAPVAQPYVFFPPPPASTLTGEELCFVREPCPLAPGRYRSSLFAAEVAFTLPNGTWTNSADEFDGIAITDGELGISFMSAAERTWSPYSIRPDRTWDPSEIRDWPSRQEGLEVSRIVDGPDLDGRPTRRFDIANVGEQEEELLRKSAYLGVWATGASYQLPAGASVRLLFVDVDGQTVVVGLEAPTATFAADMRRLETVLRTIDFEEPPRVLTGTEPCARYREPCATDPGHYFSRQFHVAFDLPEGDWTNTINWPNALAFSDGEQSLTFLSGEYEACWYGGANFCTGWWKPPSITSPRDLRKHLDRDSVLEATRIDRTMTLDGRPVQAFDVRNVDDSQWSELIYEIQSGGYWMASGQSVRLHFLEIDGEPVIVALEAPTRSFRAYLDSMQPVLDSIQFEDQR